MGNLVLNLYLNFHFLKQARDEEKLIIKQVFHDHLISKNTVEQEENIQYH